MSIRKKMTMQFAGIVAIILLLFSLTVYYFTSLYRQHDFFKRISARASIVAKVVLEKDEVSARQHQLHIRRYYALLPEEIVQVYDKTGKIIFSGGKGTLTPEPAFLEKVKVRHHVESEMGDRQIVGIYYPDNQGNFLVVASSVDLYSLKKLSNLKVILIVGFIGSMVVVIAAGWIFSRQAFQPISKIVNEVESISASDLHRRLSGATGKDEVSKLALTFNNMLDRLETSFEMQSTFVSSASHELRTPLTAIIGEIEVALMQQRESTEYERVLASILDDARMLARLSNGLLQIAQASTDVSKIKQKLLRFDELIWSAQEEAQKRHPEIPVEVHFEKYPEDEEMLLLNGNESLLLVALLNVFENAGKFSKSGQVIAVNVAISDRQFTVKVKDQGIGIQESDLVNVFVPFFRAQNVRDISGHGIGLPLAERIVKLHRGTIRVLSSLGKGTEVIIRIPARR